MNPHEHVPLDFKRIQPAEQISASREFLGRMASRRSVRFFASEPVLFELIENAIRCASLAPSGANQQPWTFVVVKDPETKRKIREAAEAEERESYEHRMPADWLEALAPLGTDWHKEFLETAPYLIVVFRIDFGLTQTAEGEIKTKQLLRAGVRWHRYGVSSRCPAHERPGYPHSHSEPDGISLQYSQPAEE
jgi:iodotyrosine deiodinase